MSSDPPGPYARLASLQAAGDSAAFLVFAAIGRGNHGSEDGSVFTVAAPFLLAWLALAPPLGAYPLPEERPEEWKASLLVLAPAWAAAVPCGCALRGLVQGYPPPTAFWVVALVATAVLLSASRMAHFAAIERPGRAIDSFVDAILDDDD